MTLVIGGIVITICDEYTSNAELIRDKVRAFCIGINTFNIIICSIVIPKKFKFIRSVRMRQKKYLLKYESCKYHPLKK